jgi:hypothetical protein
MEPVLVKVSVKSMALLFHGCIPDYIAKVCHGRCCTPKATGPLVAILPAEQARIKDAGGQVVNGLLKQKPDKRCPFHSRATGLCNLHSGGLNWESIPSTNKPFSCVVNPFTLSKRDVLIVRNRYKLLICYRKPRTAFNKGKPMPAYIAFKSALHRLFTACDYDWMCKYMHRAIRKDFILLYINATAYEAMRYRETTIKGGQHAKP